ncbi:adenosylcobinamide-GDP ribazoletransferase [Aquincola sp. S2]|uniref:Adenosylcobinamide-GDP ribazoletransferase n=1 Tax=Pseudaquabacterium terrae TaxID=2732868 RepID=A0ABX2EPI7_9BURK|nr:adenosylcobinamide-GDP ribazoletransferase [Aquabacterium terrae]NRF70462.1 adenosylcobinamide-GDP ribazoletransferase [Aquabacterium terrae]
MNEWRRLALALQFLTRLPVHVEAFEPTELNRCARYFPLVGALVGAFGAAVFVIAAHWWPLPVAVGLSIAATVWLTGGFHEDGLADTCDGLGGAVSRERALEIMKDSRLGSYGVLGLVVTLGLKAALLLALAQHAPLRAALAMVFTHAASRAAAVVLLVALPYAGDAAQAKAKPLAQRATAVELTIALGSVVLLGAAAGPTLGWPSLALAIVLAALMLAWLARWLKRRLGGFTGDTLGATQQCCEVALLLGLAAVL